MPSKSDKILLTGLPGCGKTTAVMKIIANLDPKAIAGFYTQEIRENDTRKGFRWTTLDGAAGILAHVDIRSLFKVGRYAVDIAGFEESVVPVLDPRRTDARLFVIDEIGKMECFSKKFVDVVRCLFDSDRAVLATVAQKGPGLIAEIKAHPHGEIFNLTRQNRDALITRILARISSFGTS
ncbi:MAG: NTPase [Planctomycetota bacterium]|jgi:nucleoside-triphosphatase THEP1